MTTETPARIGRYRVRGVLGQGGMGRVLLAKDELLERDVAIKILREDLPLSPELRTALLERMKQEAKAAAAVSHPHMVTLHDLGDDPTVGLYLVFECISGETLRERIATRGRLSKAQVEKLARELSSALDHAHASGIVHRDIKPENIMLGPSGAKITDFGVARLPDSTLTAPGVAIGTLAYSAPEAIGAGAFTARSDQFSLAATLAEALTGERAFSGRDALAVAARIATGDAESIPRALGHVRGSDAVSDILGRGMARDPAKRYASCTEFADALALALADLEDETVTLAAGKPVPLPMGTSRRKQNVLIAVALLVIVGLALLGRKEDRGGGIFERVSHALASASASMRARDAGRPPARPIAPPRSATAKPSLSATPSALPSPAESTSGVTHAPPATSR